MILPTRQQQTTYCTLTERQIDGHRYTEQIQRVRKRVKEKGRGTEADFEHHACRQITGTSWKMAVGLSKREKLNCKPVSQQRCDQ